MSRAEERLGSLMKVLSASDRDIIVAAMTERYAQGKAVGQNLANDPQSHPGAKVLADLAKSLTAWMAAIVFFAPDILPLLQESLPPLIGPQATTAVLTIAVKAIALATLYGRIRAKVIGAGT